MPDPIRILHLTTGSGPIAGAEQVLVDLAKATPHDRLHLSFATIAPSGPLQNEVRSRGWDAASLDATTPFALPVAASRLRRLVREQTPDILHVHLHHASVLGALARPRRVALVQTRHYSDYMLRYASGPHQWLDGFAARRCRVVAAVSGASAEHLARREGVPRERIRVVPNGVDWNTLSSTDPKPGRRVLHEAGCTSGAVVGCAATYHPRKGHADLLRAFARVGQRHPSARLVLLGPGTESVELAARLQEFGLKDRVFPLGFQKDARAILAALDLYVQPSQEEGFGIAVLEAMAMARPVVATDVGGMRETVEHGVTGLRVPPGDPGALAQAISKLLSDPARAAAMGKAGSARIRAHYDASRMVDAYARLYEDVMKGGGPNGRSFS